MQNRALTSATRLGRLGRTALAAALSAAVVPAGLVTAPAPAHADGIRDASWHLKALRIAEAHKISQGEGVKVAVIDTGVDPNHQDLRGNVLPGADAYGGGKGHQDLQGHGTSTASIIAGHGHGPGNTDGILGIAPKAKIIPINVDPPKSPLIEPKMIGDAIKLAVHMGAQVICVAIAGSQDATQKAAVEFATQRNVLVIAGAGNKPELLFVGSPASIKLAVAVSATGRDGKLDPISVTGREMDIAAPGADIPSALPGNRYRTGTGTSTATAVVAGAAALIRAKYPNEDRNKFLERLVWNTNDAGPRGADTQYGWGTLDVMKALTTATPTAPFATGAPQTSGAESAAQPDGTSAAPERELPLWPFAVVAVGLLALIGFVVALALRHRRRPAPVAQAGQAQPWVGQPGVGPPGVGPPGVGPPGVGPPGVGPRGVGPPPAGPPMGDSEWRRPGASSGAPPPGSSPPPGGGAPPPA